MYRDLTHHYLIFVINLDLDNFFPNAVLDQIKNNEAHLTQFRLGHCASNRIIAACDQPAFSPMIRQVTMSLVL
jgi:hypothetical protein